MTEEPMGEAKQKKDAAEAEALEALNTVARRISALPPGAEDVPPTAEEAAEFDAAADRLVLLFVRGAVTPLKDGPPIVAAAIREALRYVLERQQTQLARMWTIVTAVAVREGRVVVTRAELDAIDKRVFDMTHREDEAGITVEAHEVESHSPTIAVVPSVHLAARKGGA